MTPGVLGAAVELQEFCVQRNWRFCIIGGLAIARWGEPRVTQDVDVTLLTGFGGEEPFAVDLLARFEARVPEAMAFALRNRVLLLSTRTGTPIDVAFGGLPFEERSMDRASDFELAPGTVLRTCSAEDLVVHKVFAGREKDWLDVRGILVRQTDRLDLGLIREEVQPLLELKGTPEALDRFEQLVAESR